MTGLRGLPKLRITPKKKETPNPCQAEVAAMLACWASSRDLSHEGACRDLVSALQDCMSRQAGGRRKQRPTINYRVLNHSPSLARLLKPHFNRPCPSLTKRSIMLHIHFSGPSTLHFLPCIPLPPSHRPLQSVHLIVSPSPILNSSMGRSHVPCS
ncbi:hypothetical protein BT69DRAFT_1221951 [Atractiella rhizophila]|nr:hypothetical protein BT69DRAFT_1221951 [Atractiella rhizophila]